MILKFALVFGLQLLPAIFAGPKSALAINNNGTVEPQCNKFFVHTGASGNSHITLKGLSLKDCQFYCRTVYQQHCQMFSLDNQGYCNLYNMPLKTYAEKGYLIGGPTSPARADCFDLSQNLPCSGTVHADCGKEGKKLLHKWPMNEDECQSLCKTTDGCQLYQFNHLDYPAPGDGACELYDSDKQDYCLHMAVDRDAELTPECRTHFPYTA